MLLRLSIRGVLWVFVLAGTTPAMKAADEKQMEAWWKDLEKGETEATRALLSLSATPKPTVEFLARKMKPLKLTSGQAKALLLKLGNDDENVWKPAFEELEYFDPRLAIDLQALMERYTEAPRRQRLVEVLSGRPAGQLTDKTVTLRPVGADGFNFSAQPNFGSWWAEHKVERINSADWSGRRKKWTRAVRAIVLLEFIATPEAKKILEEMATGHPDAQPTKVAKAALVSLGKP